MTTYVSHEVNPGLMRALIAGAPPEEELTCWLLQLTEEI